MSRRAVRLADRADVAHDALTKLPAVTLGFWVIKILARRFHPFLYWATIIASTTAGTTMADFADRSLDIG